jgi:ABC-type multidrug transport system ATPase subunit
LFEAEILSSRVGIINRGSLVAEGTPAELRDMHKDQRVTVFRFAKWDSSLKNFFEDLNVELVEINQIQKSISVIIPQVEKQTPIIIENLTQHKHPMIEVRHEYPTLERIYLELLETERIPREEEEEIEE